MGPNATFGAFRDSAASIMFHYRHTAFDITSRYAAPKGRPVIVKATECPTANVILHHCEVAKLRSDEKANLAELSNNARRKFHRPKSYVQFIHDRVKS